MHICYFTLLLTVDLMNEVRIEEEEEQVQIREFHNLGVNLMPEDFLGILI